MPSDPSGGTVESMMDRVDFDGKVLQASQEPWYLSPIEGSQISNSTNYFGLRHDSTLGKLSASTFSEVQNRAIVHRTWGLLGAGAGYGPNFKYNEYNKTTSTLSGMIQLLNRKLISLMLASRPLKAVARMILPVPGEGPDLNKEGNYKVAIEAVAIADCEDHIAAARAYSPFSYNGGPYHVTGAFLAQGAASLLYVRKFENGIIGGCLTPAVLGVDLMVRIVVVGANLRVKIL